MIARQIIHSLRDNAMNAQSASTTRSQHLVPRVAEADSRFSRNHPGLLASLGFAAVLLVSAPALAATAPPLGAAAGYAALGPTGVTCTTSTINGDVGTTAASITDTGPCTHNGTWNVGLPGTIVNAINAAKGAIDGQSCTQTLTSTLAGVTLGPGVYCFTGAATLTGNLTLSGPSNGIWIFRIGTGGGGALTATSFNVHMDGGGQACNVYWRTQDAASMTTSNFLGTILSGIDISLTGPGTYGGRALATGFLTMTNVQPLTFAGCNAPTPGSITIDKIAVGGDDTFAYTGTVDGAFNIITAGGTGNHQKTGLAANTYTVTETAGPAGWFQTGLACTDSTAGSTFGYSGATATITLAAGGTVTCTYTNARAGSITINKIAVGGDATFAYTGTLDGLFNITTASGTGNHQKTNVPAGLYTVTETAGPAGWTLTNLACANVGAVAAGFTINPPTATIDFRTGGIVTCTFTNKLNSATITVNKDFIPNSNATVPVGLICTSGTVTTPSLNAAEGAPAVFTVTGASSGATCTATETVPAGYTANQANCVNVVLNGSCTITNTLIPLQPFTSIPTLAEWALIMLAMLLLVTGWLQYRRRQ
jgi:hypothetical protein